MATDLMSAPDETGVGEINKYDFVTPSHGGVQGRERAECEDGVRRSRR